ncbi:MAG: hypothetical protein AB8B55_14665 [Mariniblastus sp.]
MRKFILLTVLALCLGCSSDQSSDNSQAVQEPASSSSSSDKTAAPVAPPVAETPPAKEVKLPFDMPMMPGARYLSGSKFSRPTKRRGPEAMATIIAKGTTQDVVEFYKTALLENGFSADFGGANDESSRSVYGLRENGEKCSITTMKGGSKAGPGECQTAIIATKPLANPEEKK